MHAKSEHSPPEWVDPDDAPELTAEMLEHATPRIGEREVTWEEFRQAVKDRGMDTPPYDDSKVGFVFRLDTDILNAFIAAGEDWEQRMNDALREWMKANLP